VFFLDEASEVNINQVDMVKTQQEPLIVLKKVNGFKLTNAGNIPDLKLAQIDYQEIKP
jgi:hypothetical protein